MSKRKIEITVPLRVAINWDGPLELLRVMDSRIEPWQDATGGGHEDGQSYSYTIKAQKPTKEEVRQALSTALRGAAERGGE